MAIPDFLRRRDSLSKGPDYSAKGETVAFLKGIKKAPNEVDYKPVPTDSVKRCHECVSYRKPGQPESDCAKVVGVVKAEGTCDLWKQRSYENEAPGAGEKKTEIVIRLG